MTAVAQPVADKIADKVDAYVSDEEKQNPRVMKARDLCNAQKQTAVRNVLG